MPGARRKQKRVHTKPGTHLLAIPIAVLFILLVLLLVNQGQHTPTIDKVCKLYANDIATKNYVEPPAYNCKLTCPGIKTLGYCPEETYMYLVLERRAQELLGSRELNSEVISDLRSIHDAVRQIYALIMANDPTVETYRHSSLKTMFFFLRYGSVYEVLKEYKDTGDLRVLDNLYEGLELRGGR